MHQFLLFCSSVPLSVLLKSRRGSHKSCHATTKTKKIPFLKQVAQMNSPLTILFLNPTNHRQTECHTFDLRSCPIYYRPADTATTHVYQTPMFFCQMTKNSRLKGSFAQIQVQIAHPSSYHSDIFPHRHNSCTHQPCCLRVLQTIWPPRNYHENTPTNLPNYQNVGRHPKSNV